MTKRMKAIIVVLISIAALGAVAVAIAPTVYRAFFVQPAAQMPTLSADDSALGQEGLSDTLPEAPLLDGSVAAEDGTPLDPEALSGDWVASSGTFAGYRVDEVLRGSAVTVTGRTEEVTGSMLVEGLTLESAEFQVDVASISTDSPQRDDYFRNDAMNASTHPTATFELAEPVVFAHTPASGEIITQQVRGDLTLAGTTQSVEFEAQLRSDGSTTEVAGQIPVVFADFGVEAPSLGFVSVEPEGFVEFTIVAVKA